MFSQKNSLRSIFIVFFCLMTVTAGFFLCVTQLGSYAVLVCPSQGSERCRPSWLTNSALVYEPNCGERVLGSQPMSTAVRMEPK